MTYATQQNDRPRAAAHIWPYPHRTIAEIDRRARAEWLLREDKMLRVGVEIGMTFKEIAAIIPGRTRNSCIDRARRLGIFSLSGGS